MYAPSSIIQRSAITKLLVLLLVLAVSGCAESNPAAENEGAKAASDWVSLIDQADYSSSWHEAAEVFKNQVSEENWRQMVIAARQPLGTIVQRTVSETQYAKSLPGVPDGEYVVVIFDTEFSDKKQAVETVTVLKTTQGGWAAAGYFVR